MEPQTRFDQFYRVHGPDLYHYVYRHAKSYNDADDIFQELCWRVHTALEKGHNISSLRKWAYGVARNEILKWMQKKENSLVCYHNDGLERIVADADETDAQEENEHTLHSLWSKIASLHQPYQIVLTLRYGQGLDNKQIAKELRISKENVKVNICRGLKSLRKRLPVT